MRRVGHLEMSDSSIWRRVKYWGEQFRQREQARQRQQMSLPPKHEVVGGQRPEPRRMGVGLDGAMVHLRTEGWKELRISN